MDIELLSKMIAELVPDHPEVGLPGLGTFVSEFVPASFTDRGYTITPPYKRVTFVPGAVTNNSLVELYARSNGLSEDQARAALSQFLEDTKKVLLDRKTVVFPGLGRLRATRQNNIFFITDEALDIYPEGFGLEPVSLKNHEETPAEVHHVVESLAGIMVAPTEEFVEPAGAASKSTVAAEEPAGAVEVPAGEKAAEAPAEYEPIIPADERLEFADEPAKAADEPVPGEGSEPDGEEGRNQNGAKMLHPPGKNEGGVSKKAKNAAAKAAKAQAKADAKASKVQARADRNAAKAQARTDRADAKADAKASKAQAKAQAKAERKAARAEAREAKAQARAARRAARKPVPKWIWVTPLVILAILAIAAGVFYILVYAAPDFLDTLLYTPEELRIINW